MSFGKPPGLVRRLRGALGERGADGLRANDSVNVLLVDTLGLEAEELQALVALRRSRGDAAVVLLVAEADPGAYLDLPVERVLSRRAPTDELFAALDELARPVGRVRAGSLPFELSRRELECAQLVARGLSNRRIAELTGLREQSVKNVVSLAMRKMSVENRVQVALRLGQAGVADAAPDARRRLHHGSRGRRRGPKD